MTYRGFLIGGVLALTLPGIAPATELTVSPGPHGTVHFGAHLDGNRIGAKKIDFGDGISDGIPVPCGSKGLPGCPLAELPVSETHVYERPGQYTVKVRDVVSGNVLASATLVVAVGSEVPPTPSMPERAPDADRLEFRATPVSGTAPLTVTFTCGDDCHAVAGKRIYFGDGSREEMAIQAGYACPPDASCRPPTFHVRHTYAKPGVYRVELRDTRFDVACPPNAQCLDPVRGRMIIHVSDGVSAALPERHVTRYRPWKRQAANGTQGYQRRTT